MNEKKEIRLPLWLQLSIMLSLLIFTLTWSVSSIGKGEYRKQFCIEKLNANGIELSETDKAGFFQDFKSSYTELDSYRVMNVTLKREVDKEANTEYEIGCCRVPKGAEKISKSQNCIYTPEYKEIDLKEKMSYFLKRFK